MIDLYSLVKKTSAYKLVEGEKAGGRLSHAYLITTADQTFQLDYLKIFAGLIAVDENSSGANRAIKLINEKAHPDVIFFPKGEKEVVVEDVDTLVGESVVKPIELTKKVFVVERADKMNARAQNKLLKTLEEPPNGVHIILGASADFNLLPTVKSRVKQVAIPTFSQDEIFSVLSSECVDGDRLLSAISCGDGTVGKAYSLYSDENLATALSLAESVFLDMKSSRDVLEFSNKVSALKCDFSDFLAVLDLLGRDLLCHVEGRDDLIVNKKSFNKTKNADGFNRGALLYMQSAIVEASRRKKFNANNTMLIEWLLFQILEGKFKWRKS